MLRRRLIMRQLLFCGHTPLPYFYLDVLRARGTLSREIERVRAMEEKWQSVKHLLSPENLSDEEWTMVLQKARKAVGDEEGRFSLEQICAALGFNDVLQLIRQLLKEESDKLLEKDEKA